MSTQPGEGGASDVELVPVSANASSRFSVLHFYWHHFACGLQFPMADSPRDSAAPVRRAARFEYARRVHGSAGLRPTRGRRAGLRATRPGQRRSGVTGSRQRGDEQRRCEQRRDDNGGSVAPRRNSWERLEPERRAAAPQVADRAAPCVMTSKAWPGHASESDQRPRPCSGLREGRGQAAGGRFRPRQWRAVAESRRHGGLRDYAIVANSTTFKALGDVVYRRYYVASRRPTAGPPPS